ncbi:hypothetical protein AB0B04_19030 [Streptomyces xinghaiensis]|uniref:Uncharacterized protein n=2 Tax=Streptomyces TaxID=1883 RepID=A0A420UXW7_9ACTN|nr:MULTISPECIES: hypothetical protein [Streptomyces]KNE83299.1 hypothetical protein ADZ36_05515 [Streptomyces fradiae]OFA36628.1 hypothetical protein BEN35_29665 [Streptomyces fradiae]PQM20625.1 hypothetical protein Sfr7A_25910 [Streptomyces xinghaiensis]RKM92567.1 hypothetical protein SFRA_024565 [Streptomyces xinghaiensis]RNC70534.1 hypothetical protein DC095_025555 [Streptomyces xinghaiensis]
MTTLWPDRSYAPVNVYENGWLVRAKARVRTGHCRTCLGVGCGKPEVKPSYDGPYSRVPHEMITHGMMLMPGWQADPAEPVGCTSSPQPASV